MNPAQSLPRSAGPGNKDAAALSATCVRFSSYYRLEYVEELDFGAEDVCRNASLADQDTMTRALRRFPRIASILFPLYPFNQSEGDTKNTAVGPVEDPRSPRRQLFPFSKLLRNPFWALAPSSARLAVQHLSLDTVAWDVRGLMNLLDSVTALRCLSIRHTVRCCHHAGSSVGRLGDVEILDSALRSLPKTLVTLSLELNTLRLHSTRPPRSPYLYPSPVSKLSPSLLPNIQELYVDFTFLEESNCAVLSQLVTLRTLRLGCWTGTSTRTIRVSSIANAISQLTRLQSLSIIHVGSMLRQAREEIRFLFESLPPSLTELTAVFGLAKNTNGVRNFHIAGPGRYRMENLRPLCFKHCPLLRKIIVGLRGKINRPSWEHLLAV